MFLIYDAGTLFSIYAYWCHSYESRSSRCHIFSKQQARYGLVMLNFVIFQYPEILKPIFCFGISGAFSHGFTYSGHPVSCAVAIEALKIYKWVGDYGSHFSILICTFLTLNIHMTGRGTYQNMSPKFPQGFKMVLKLLPRVVLLLERYNVTHQPICWSLWLNIFVMVFR